jgi:hypothetical protein
VHSIRPDGMPEKPNVIIKFHAGPDPYIMYKSSLLQSLHTADPHLLMLAAPRWDTYYSRTS